MSKDINILYLSDNNYAAYAGISITSLFENNKHFDNITVYVIDDSISEENKKKYLKTAEKYGRKIVFLDMSSSIKKLEEMGATKYRNSYTTYLKLFTFGILPEEVERIFFIDSDALVVDRLDDILNFDMKGMPIAAVRDALCTEYKVSLGIPAEDPWFNMGVMLVDVKKWKEFDCENRVIAQMKKRSSYVAVDQDLLNISIHGQIETLPPQYNATPHHYVYDHDQFMKWFPQTCFYNKEEIEYSIKHPVIHHFERFVGESPWHKGTTHPYTKEFDYYMSISEWKDYVKKPANLNTTMKIEKALYKTLPKKMFLPIWAYFYKRYFKKTSEKLASNEMKNITV